MTVTWTAQEAHEARQEATRRYLAQSSHTFEEALAGGFEWFALVAAEAMAKGATMEEAAQVASEAWDTLSTRS